MIEDSSFLPTIEEFFIRTAVDMWIDTAPVVRANHIHATTTRKKALSTPKLLSPGGLPAFSYFDFLIDYDTFKLFQDMGKNTIKTSSIILFRQK